MDMKPEILDPEEEKERICPYLEITCLETFCPCWMEEIPDCLFHVILMGLKEHVRQAARWLDNVLGNEPNESLKSLEAMRIMLQQADPKEIAPLVKQLIGQVLLEKLRHMEIGQISDFLSKLDWDLLRDLGLFE